MLSSNSRFNFGPQPSSFQPSSSQPSTCSQITLISTSLEFPTIPPNGRLMDASSSVSGPVSSLDSSLSTTPPMRTPQSRLSDRLANSVLLQTSLMDLPLDTSPLSFQSSASLSPSSFPSSGLPCTELPSLPLECLDASQLPSPSMDMAQS